MCEWQLRWAVSQTGREREQQPYREGIQAQANLLAG